MLLARLDRPNSLFVREAAGVGCKVACARARVVGPPVRERVVAGRHELVLLEALPQIADAAQHRAGDKESWQALQRSGGVTPLAGRGETRLQRQGQLGCNIRSHLEDDCHALAVRKRREGSSGVGEMQRQRV